MTRLSGSTGTCVGFQALAVDVSRFPVVLCHPHIGFLIKCTRPKVCIALPEGPSVYGPGRVSGGYRFRLFVFDVVSGSCWNDMHSEITWSHRKHSCSSCTTIRCREQSEPGSEFEGLESRRVLVSSNNLKLPVHSCLCCPDQETPFLLAVKVIHEGERINEAVSFLNQCRQRISFSRPSMVSQKLMRKHLRVATVKRYKRHRHIWSTPQTLLQESSITF
jgi:hypothetical protein